MIFEDITKAAVQQCRCCFVSVRCQASFPKRSKAFAMIAVTVCISEESERLSCALSRPMLSATRGRIVRPEISSLSGNRVEAGNDISPLLSTGAPHGKDSAHIIPKTCSGESFSVHLHLSYTEVNRRVRFIFRPLFAWNNAQQENCAFITMFLY